MVNPDLAMREVLSRLIYFYATLKVREHIARKKKNVLQEAQAREDSDLILDAIIEGGQQEALIAREMAADMCFDWDTMEIQRDPKNAERIDLGTHRKTDS